MNVFLHYFRYDAALERKTKISEIIRSLDLPNNPLDDIVDQVVISTRLTFLLWKDPFQYVNNITTV